MTSRVRVTFLIILRALLLQSSCGSTICPFCKDDVFVRQLITPDCQICTANEQFILNGKPFRVLSGSIHYFRIPPQYWSDRLYKMKAAGLTAISVYVDWSFHEPEPQKYMFNGERDIVKFLKLAAMHELYVLLRPGPYISAERDLGGLPYWLYSKYPSITVRSQDSDFLRETFIWFDELFSKITPLLFGNGGPIIMVQVENEYGSYGSDGKYMEQLRDRLIGHIGNKSLLYTADGLDYIKRGNVAGAIAAVNFGTDGDVDYSFDLIREQWPGSPLFSAEYYTGWVTHWGDSRIARCDEIEIMTKFLEILQYTTNINFHMFHGGTNFEFTSGANYQGGYKPVVTSYDYDAPLTEAGDPTSKYYAIRDALTQFNPETNRIPPPMPALKGAYGNFSIQPLFNILSHTGRSKLGKPYETFIGTMLPTFEQLQQRAGFILYETQLNITTNGSLTILIPRDRIYVYVDKIFQGLIDRMKNLTSINIVANAGSNLSLLVENQGRINYMYLYDLKGILSEVLIDNNIINGSWAITGYPLQFLQQKFRTKDKNVDLKYGPVIYESKFLLVDNLMDTFLDTTGWGKGVAWINGHNLGRYWPNVGPQVTLYVPGVWLKGFPKYNVIQILELENAPVNPTIQFVHRHKFYSVNS